MQMRGFFVRDKRGRDRADVIGVLPRAAPQSYVMPAGRVVPQERPRRVLIAAFDPNTFAPWTGKHAVLVAGVATLGLGLVYLGRRVPLAWRPTIDRTLGVAAFLVWLAGCSQDAFRGGATLRNGLPLHWCDVTGLLAVVVLLAPRYRVPRTLLHFWGLCICSLAFVVPTITVGPARVDFWAYVGTHAMIVCAALYDRGVRDYRPSRYDFAAAIGCAVLFAMLLQPVNLLLGANYGYVGRTAFGVTRALDRLMPWPGRVVVLIGVELLAMAALLATGKAIIALRRERRRCADARLPVRLRRPATPLVAWRRAA